MEKEIPSILNVSILVGPAENPELQAPLFGLFFLIYVNSFEWNLGTIMLTNKQHATNTYELFFLRHPAFTTFDFSTALGPKKMLGNLKGMKIP